MHKLFIALSLSCSALLINSQAIAQSIQPLKTSLTDTDKQLIAWVSEREAQILDELKTHVEINTGSDNIEGLDQYRGILQKELEGLGFATRLESSSPLEQLSCAGGKVEIADHLVAEIKGKGRRILMNGHMDTVFSADDEFQTLKIEEDGTLKGPGVADMKGGIVVMINALRAVKSLGLLDDANITVLFNSDEEIGSLGSRELIEDLAAKHDIGLVYEGTYNHQMTRARKGLGQVRLKITGRESHAGAAHQEGVSASLEMAHKMIAMEALTDYETESTVNVGVMSGGEKRNTVPGCADAHVDMRFVSAEAGQALLEEVKEIAEQTHVHNPRYPEYPKTESWSVLHRPAKPVDPQVDELIGMAMGLSALIAEPITGARYSGGGTDGSIAQSVGLPTVDSLGLDGVGAHSSREATSVTSLIARTKLAAVMLARLLQESE